MFDVEQTEGEPLPEFARPSGNPGDAIERVEALIRAKGIELDYNELDDCFGYSAKGRIVLQAGLESALRLSVLLHELAHEMMHGTSDVREQTTKELRETEAEAVAHVVCRALGVRCLEHSADYISLHNGSTELLGKSMQRIQSCAGGILKELAAGLPTAGVSLKRPPQDTGQECLVTSA